jgi:cytochrome P450
MPRLPPGPVFAPLQTLRYVRDVEALFRACARRYGDPFTLPTLFGTFVVTGHPDGIKEIYTADPDTFDSFGAEAFEPLVGKSSMLVINGERHRRERKLLMPAFHGDRMRVYGQLIQEIVLARRFHPGERFVAQEVCLRMALEIMIQAVFGIDDPERIASFHRINEAFAKGLHRIFLFAPALQTPWIPAWRRFLAQQARIRQLIQEEIDYRRGAGGAHEDILSLLLAARDDQGQPMSDEELIDELLTMVAAGHNTTALSITWALFWIHREKRVLETLRDELARLGAGAPPDALARLPYLGAVLDETMRIRPVVAMTPRRLRVPFRLRGWDLPAGMAVSTALGLAHERADLYPRPEEFRPERFLERKFTPFEFFPFGGGARRCMGAALASYEMRVVVGTMLTHHRLTLRSDAVPRTERHSVTFGPEGGVAMVYEGSLGQP